MIFCSKIRCNEPINQDGKKLVRDCTPIYILTLFFLPHTRRKIRKIQKIKRSEQFQYKQQDGEERKLKIEKNASPSKTFKYTKNTETFEEIDLNERRTKYL